MKLIGIYSGQFQPPHRGNLIAYKRLRQITGAETFIATTDVVSVPDQPLSFEDKEQIWVRHGVPSNRVMNVENIYKPIEITQLFNASSTAVIFIFNSKDMKKIGRLGRDPTTGKKIYIKVNGNELSYFQPYEENKSNLEPLNKHGYVIVIDDFSIDNRPINSSTIRKGMGSPQFTKEHKIVFFKWVFGWYDPSLFDLMKDKYTEAQKSESVIKELINTPQGTTLTTNTDNAATDLSKGADKAAKDLESNNKKMAAAEKDLAMKKLAADKNDLKFKQSDILAKKKSIPINQKKISDLNKSIATGSPPPPL